jgi:hypothetical protein
MISPDFEATGSNSQEAPAELSDQPLTIGEATFLGGMLAPSMLFIGQMIEPVPPLTDVSSYPTEFALMGGLAVAGAIAGSVVTYTAQRFRQWRDQKSQKAIAERINAVANPVYVQAGLEQFSSILDQRSSH